MPYVYVQVPSRLALKSEQQTIERGSCCSMPHLLAPAAWARTLGLAGFGTQSCFSNPA